MAWMKNTIMEMKEMKRVGEAITAVVEDQAQKVQVGKWKENQISMKDIQIIFKIVLRQFLVQAG